MADKWRKTKPFLILALAGLLFFSLAPTTKSEVKDAEKVREGCEALTYKEQCYAKAMASLTTETNMAYAFQVLRALQEQDQGARGCHFIAHAISIAETKKDPANWRDVVNQAPQDCSYGAVHGPLEYYASTFPDGKIPDDQIGTLCHNPDKNNCSHGLGHVLLVVFENDIDKAAARCEALPQGAHAIFECLTGVFMERITAINLEIHGLAGKEALNWPERVPELLKLCEAQSGKRSVACWKEIAHAAIVKLNFDPQKVVDFCQAAPGEEEAKQCLEHSVGILAGHESFNFARMGRICEVEAEAPDYRTRCYNLLVQSTLSTLPNEISKAKSFCQELDAPYDQSCLLAVKEIETRKAVPLKTGD